jgi:predicted secreted Zn-dependent protease
LARLGDAAARIVLPVLFLLGLAVAGQAADTVKMSTNYYKVFGSTPREVRRSINQQRPWKDKDAMDAQTDWSVRCKYAVIDDAGVSRVQSFRTETVIVITLPVWQAPSGTPKEYTDRWQKYFTALLRHENGHAGHALLAAAEVRKQAGAIHEASNGDELTRRINDTVTKILRGFREKGEEYDRETRHGVTQGATFP